MAFPEPMLSTPARAWPSGDAWVMQPKWDGFRVLMEVTAEGRVRAWSRHGTNLTARLGAWAETFGDAAPRSVFDGELVALADTTGRPAQDFAAVCRAVLRSDRGAEKRLRYVAFDVLELAGEDVRRVRWRQRNEQLTAALPDSPLVRRIESLPASPDAHWRIVELGFEGTVLKRPESVYRPGRRRTWLKIKARHLVDGVLVEVRQDRKGYWWGICDVAGRRVAAAAAEAACERVGSPGGGRLLARGRGRSIA